MEGLPNKTEQIMPVTIYDVAKRAGVGIGTVSRVLNESPQISPKTREKVLKAIRELQYRPHALARGLARNKTGMIAVVMPFFIGYFYFELLRTIQHELNKKGYDLILYNVEKPNQLDNIFEKSLKERRVDGLLILSIPISEAHVMELERHRFPVVLVDTKHPRLDSIKVENKQGAYAAVSYLISLGHQKIGMITGKLSSPPARERVEGYKKALKDKAIPLDPRYIVVPNIHEADGFNRSAGYQGLRQLASLGKERPTAIFASSDIQAAGALLAAQELRIRIPEEMAIVGFDDVELASYLGLTTMRQPLEDMGKLAVERLIERITKKAHGVIQRQFIPQLVIRNTSGILQMEKVDFIMEKKT